MRKSLPIIVAIMMIAAILLSACATATPETVIQTVEVEKQVVQTQIVKETQVVVETVEVAAPTAEPAAPGSTLPRNETLYFNGPVEPNRWLEPIFFEHE